MNMTLEELDLDVLVWSVRAFYIFAAYAIIIVRFIPDLRDRFLDYGARSDGSASKLASPAATRESFLPRWFRIQFDPVLDWLAEMTVPHSWFYHFYLCSTVCSVLWLSLFYQTFSDHLSDFSLHAATSWNHRALCGLLLMQFQGSRRLYECLITAKSSQSRMWVGHYLIGIAFYLVTNVAVWLEAGHCLQPVTAVDSKQGPMHTGQMAENLFNGARTAGCVVVFFYNSYRQYQVHKYLASLTSYQVPNHPMFTQTNLICPHYGFEVNIYLALAILTAQDLRVFNVTMLCAVGFVGVNLGVTADGTKKWMMKKFPKQRSEIAQRHRMFSIW